MKTSTDQRGVSPFFVLALCLALSLIVHAGFFLYFNNFTELASKKTRIADKRLTAKINNLPPSYLKSTENHPSKIDRDRNSITSTEHPTASDPAPSPTISNLPYLADELDTQPELIDELDLDNLINKSTDLNGRIQFLLLISSAGIALWTYVEYSDFPPEVTEQITSSFLTSRYLAAVKQGQPTSALIRIEVDHTRDGY